MKVKQVYVANDGREFNTEDQCLSYEKSVSHADKYKSISALWNTREGLNTTSFIQDNYDKIKAIMEPVESKDIQQVDWSKVPKGTMIRVKDNTDDSWSERPFMYYYPLALTKISCYSIKGTSEVYWKHAELITEEEAQTKGTK